MILVIKCVRKGINEFVINDPLLRKWFLIDNPPSSPMVITLLSPAMIARPASAPSKVVFLRTIN